MEMEVFGEEYILDSGTMERECRSTTVFDFIVIGAGTAGSVVAARLAEIGDWNIVVLEAGSDPPMTSDVPFYWLNLQRTDMDWLFQTVREKGLFNGLMGKVNRWPRGKVLGGTSTMGSMLYIRGNRRDYDNMAAAGNVGWSFEEVLPYFKKSEDMRDIKVLSSPIASIYHARGGPLTISRFGNKETITDLLQAAALELGYASNFDVNGVNMAGFTSPNQGTVRNGERINLAKAYLNPIKNQKNLFIIKHAFVSKVHICPQTRRAYAVEYYYRNEKAARVLRASREIIVCAGVVGSPKILMLSGVGPKNELDNLNIYVLQNSRVGRNLQDHVMYPGMVVTLNSGDPPHTPLDILDFSYEYLTRRTGPFSTIGATELVGFLNMDDDDVPDIQIQFFYSRLNESDTVFDLVKGLALEEDVATQYFDFNSQGDMIIPMPMLLHPRSKGQIKLKSSDPDDMPHIEAGYLDHPDDLDTLMMGVRFIERMVGSDALRPYNASIEVLYFPGCCGIDPGTDYYYACSLSHIAGTGHNQVGTCKMGPECDPESVVDPQLRVIGIKGLRVVDASVIPNTITGSPLAGIIMFAEKASDMIKIQWLQNFDPWATTVSPFGTLSAVPSERTVKPERYPYQLHAK